MNPKEQVRDRRLPGTSGTDQGHYAAARDRQVEAVERGSRPAGVGERHGIEPDVGPLRDDVDRGTRRNDRRRDGRRLDGHEPGGGRAPTRLWWLVEDRERPLGDRQTRGAGMVSGRQGAERQEELGDDDQDREGAVELDRRWSSGAG